MWVSISMTPSVSKQEEDPIFNALAKCWGTPIPTGTCTISTEASAPAAGQSDFTFLSRLSCSTSTFDPTRLGLPWALTGHLDHLAPSAGPLEIQYAHDLRTLRVLYPEYKLFRSAARELAALQFERFSPDPDLSRLEVVMMRMWEVEVVLLRREKGRRKMGCRWLGHHKHYRCRRRDRQRGTAQQLESQYGDLRVPVSPRRDENSPGVVPESRVEKKIVEISLGLDDDEKEKVEVVDVEEELVHEVVVTV